MSCFCSVYTVDEVEIQFKTGLWDEGENYGVHYHVGDTFKDAAPNSWYPGVGIDDIYYGISMEGKHPDYIFHNWWVVVKDGIIQEIVLITPNDEYTVPPHIRAELLQKWWGEKIPDPDPTLWTEEQWEKKRKRDLEYELQRKKDDEDFEKETVGMDDQQKFVYLMSRSIKETMYSSSLWRQILQVKEIKDES